MSYEVTLSEDGVVRVRIIGEMRVADQQGIQGMVSLMMSDEANLRLIAELQDFRGWEKDEAWGDLNFLLGNVGGIARMALVGEERWRERALLFVGKGYRDTAIEYFQTRAEAEAWVRG